MSIENGHWYSKDGQPKHFITKKDGTGNRPTTLRDAKKELWLPSVTTILKILDAPALRQWLIRQAVYAVVTAPDVPGEGLDAKIERVLVQKKEQDEESQIARDRGTEIHDALEKYFLGQEVPADIRCWMEPAAKAICERGQLVTAEKILIGDGFAGKVDLIQEGKDCWWITDWKTSKKLPDPKKGAWVEHRLQASAYAAAAHSLLMPVSTEKPIRTCNVYLSTIEPGNFVVCDHDPDWQKTYNQGFKPLLTAWRYINDFPA